MASDLRKEMAEMERRLKDAFVAAGDAATTTSSGSGARTSTGAGSRGGGGGGGGGGGEKADWTPSRVELKGWIKNWARPDDEALTPEEATQLVESLVKVLPELKEMLDLDATLGQLRGKVYLRRLGLRLPGSLDPRARKDAAWRVRNRIQGVLDDPSLHVRGHRLQIVVEAAPWEMERNAAMSRMYNLFRELQVPAERYKMERYPVLKAYVVPSAGGRHRLLVEWTGKDNGWKVDEVVLKDVAPDASLSGALAVLRA